MDGKDAIIAAQAEQIARLTEQVRTLIKRVSQLEAEVARLKKDSSNSSKPPSSDIVKPAPPASRGGGKRKRGGQPGHQRCQRQLLPPEQVDEIIEYDLPPQDAAGFEPLDDWRIVQQIELLERPFTVTEHRARRYRCRRTGKIVTAPLPQEVVRAGLLGPRLTALVAYQKSGCHMSYANIRRFLRDVLGIPVSTGQLAKVIQKASAALDGPYAELAAALPDQAYVGSDETGHKDRGKRYWTWCFRTEGFTVFHIDASRGSQVLVAMLGETFGGVIGCDYFSAYRKYMGHAGATVQFCMAHLIRDVRFLAEHPDNVLARWGDKLLGWLRKLFETLHRRARLTAAGFARSMERIRCGFLKEMRRPPPRAEAKTLAARFRSRRAEAYFTFLTTRGVPPTNNLTEQALRHVVIDRRITQGTRGRRGQRWCERAWTVLATCAQQHRSAFEFLCSAVAAHLRNAPSPSLLPENP